MKILFSFFFFLFSFFLVHAGDNTEFRATWVVTWQHINSGNTLEQNQALVRRILDNHKQANMNAVFWHARQSGTAYYRSSYEPWGSYAGYQDPGYDHLAYAVEEAHNRGMEVHAWVNVFAASSTYEGAPAQVHPEWICRDQGGIPMSSSIALSPGLEAVRLYTINMVMEIVRNYDIDGLHLDYIRWNEYSNSKLSKQSAAETEAQQPAFDGMISASQLEDMQINKAGRYLYDVDHPYSGGVPAGFSSWEEWWRWSVTEFVRVLHDSIQTVKPWVKLSVAALGRYNWGSWQGYGDVYQDAALWFNQGYIEQLAPMHYHWTSGSAFVSMLTGGQESWYPWITGGINDGRFFTVGPPSYILSEQNIWYRHPEIVNSCRTIPWVDGFQFFSYGDWSAARYWTEAREKFYQQKTKMRPALFLLEQTPPTPTAALSKLDSLHYQITVTPDPGVSLDQWFAVYRSGDDSLDPDSDEIIDIHFGPAEYVVSDTFSGNQDFNGQYRYYATMLDRYWNESEASAMFISDPIPSFAPKVLSTNPSEGDTISVNSNISLQFSKTMNTSLLQSNLSIDPTAEIYALNWSSDNKTVTIIIGNDMQFDTQYTLTIEDSLTDINGKRLDGNGDGIEGEPFVLNFRTKAVDNEGPGIIYSNVTLDGSVVDFDIDGVINFGFNEQVKKTTVTPGSVFLSRYGNTVDARAKVFTINNISVLGVQSRTKLPANSPYTLTITTAVTDTIGNSLDSTLTYQFSTSSFGYKETKMLCDFVSTTGTWEDPNYSGSTIGTIETPTTFGIDTSFYLPGYPAPIQKRSGRIFYEWNPDTNVFLLREYLSGGITRSILFDTTYILQCYVFGDGSGNKFRFAVDDKYVSDPALPQNHEVSPWYLIDWYGWKLISWDLSKNETGAWLGDGHLEGTLRFDSFQLTHSENDAIKGTVYLKNLRLVKREYLDPAGIAEEITGIPEEFYLSQNYPNPFNPVTHIDFTLPSAGWVNLKIYDILGRMVMDLVNEKMVAGRYQKTFDASALSSGTYVYILQAGNFRQAKKMVVLK